MFDLLLLVGTDGIPETTITINNFDQLSFWLGFIAATLLCGITILIISIFKKP